MTKTSYYFYTACHLGFRLGAVVLIPVRISGLHGICFVARIFLMGRSTFEGFDTQVILWTSVLTGLFFFFYNTSL